jgi:hypothetical protein
VEAGVSTALKVEGPTSLVHLGPADGKVSMGGHLGPPAAEGHGFHVISDRDTQTVVLTQTRMKSYLDGTCRTCRIDLFRIHADNAVKVGSHVHTEDEIIHVLHGEIQSGPLRITPGMALAVPGGIRYGFRSSGPFAFLNYRRNASMVAQGPNEEPREETVAAFRAMHSTT